MTDAEINFAIAGHLGWKYHPCPPGGAIVNQWQHPSGNYVLCAPKFAGNLNDMHEAEKFFEDKPIDTKSLYWDHLALITMPDPFPGDDTFLRDYAMLRATARQRAQAFLRTLNLWKD